jgi:hypothetical protein
MSNLSRTEPMRLRSRFIFPCECPSKRRFYYTKISVDDRRMAIMIVVMLPPYSF